MKFLSQTNYTGYVIIKLSKYIKINIQTFWNSFLQRTLLKKDVELDYKILELEYLRNEKSIWMEIKNIFSPFKSILFQI